MDLSLFRLFRLLASLSPLSLSISHYITQPNIANSLPSNSRHPLNLNLILSSFLLFSSILFLFCSRPALHPPQATSLALSQFPILNATVNEECSEMIYRADHNIGPAKCMFLSFTTPHHTTPHHTLPHHTTIHYTTSHHITPHHTTPHRNTPHHTTQ